MNLFFTMSLVGIVLFGCCFFFVFTGCCCVRCLFFCGCWVFSLFLGGGIIDREKLSRLVLTPFLLTAPFRLLFELFSLPFVPTGSGDL